LDLYWKLSDRCIVNHLTHEIYIANEYSNIISVFDTTTDKLEQTINTDIFSHKIDKIVQQYL
jgi:YVTN family beta-propeller protein